MVGVVNLLSPKGSSNAPKSQRGPANTGGGNTNGGIGHLGSTDLIKGVSAFNYLENDNASSNIDNNFLDDYNDGNS